MTWVHKIKRDENSGEIRKQKYEMHCGQKVLKNR